MSKLPCDVVKDLFPSYIDELTGEVTNNLIEEHTAECEDCRQALESMKSPEAEPTGQSPKKEIDYLKKTRKKNRKNILVAILVVLAIVLGGLGVKHYLVGTTMQYEYLECQVEVDGKSLTVNCLTADANLCISDIDFKEEGRVITISCKGVGKSPFYDGVSRGSYVAENNIKEVRMGDRILWANGEDISALTSRVYQTKHAYVGDMAANNETAKALYMDIVLGEYKNQLQTSEEPYGWHIQMEELRHDLDFIEKNYMQPYAYILLAMVENLGEVTYEFTYDGKPMVITITEEMATNFAGKNIKYVGMDIAELQKLIKKTGLQNIEFEEEEEQHREEGITFEILNLAEDHINVVGIDCFWREDYGMGGTECYIDRSIDTKDEVISLFIPKEVLVNEVEEIEQFYIRIKVNKDNEATLDSGDKLIVPMEFGKTYQLKLTGSAEDGYHISQ